MRKSITLVLTILIKVSMAQADIFSGICGDNLVWELNTYSGELTIVGNGAMYDFSSAPWYNYKGKIKTISFPSTITKIGKSAFKGCNYITEVNIPNSVDTIGAYAFSDLGSYCKKVVVGKNVKYIDANNKFGKADTLYWNPIACYSVDIFSGNTGNLKSLFIGDEVTYIQDELFINNDFKELIFPNSIKRIGVSAFENCKELESVIIGDGVDTIRDEAFYGCSKLKKLTLGNNVRYIGDQAFEYCDISALVLPTSLEYIGTDAFHQNSPHELESLTIPENVKHIGLHAFHNCGHTVIWDAKQYLESVSSVFDDIWSISFGDKVEYIPQILHGDNVTEVIIPDNVKEIADEAIIYCSSLNKIVVGKGLQKLGEDAFYSPADSVYLEWNAINCADLKGWRTLDRIKKLSLGNQVKRIPANFYRSGFLKHLEIPASVEQIGDSAFWGNVQLQDITCFSKNPPIIGAKSFEFTSIYKDIPIFIPCGAYDAYDAADYWKDNGVLTEPVAEYSIKVTTIDINQGKVIVIQNVTCSNNVAIVEAIPNDGFNFSRWNDGNIANPREIILDSDIELIAYFDIIGGTAVESVNTNYATPQKVIQNNHLYILRGDKVYTIQGQEVE